MSNTWALTDQTDQIKCTESICISIINGFILISVVQPKEKAEENNQLKGLLQERLSPLLSKIEFLVSSCST